MPPADEIEMPSWWRERAYDGGLTEISVTLTRRHVQLIAEHVPESTSLPEAIRMLVSQGVFILRTAPDLELQHTLPDLDDTLPAANSMWIDGVSFEDDRTSQKSNSPSAVWLISRKSPDSSRASKRRFGHSSIRPSKRGQTNLSHSRVIHSRGFKCHSTLASPTPAFTRGTAVT